MPARLLLAALAGLTLWLAFPGYDLWWLAPIAVAALTLATAGAGAVRGFAIGFVAGAAFFFPVLEWSGIYVGWLPWTALSIAQALYVGLIGAISGAWGPRGRVGAARINPVVVALAWVVSEFVRGTFPYGGFPWARLAFSQADAPVLGAVSVIGSPGVAFLVALVGATLAWAAIAAAAARAPAPESPGDDAPVPAPRRLLPLAIAAAVVATAYLAPSLIPRPVDGETLQVLGVQGNVPQLGLDFNAQRRVVLDNHVSGTLRAAELVRQGQLPPPDLVVWPENASDIDPLRNADAAEVISSAADAIGAPLLVGAVLRHEEGLHNVTLQWLPGQGPVDQYIKRRPVPFAEYIPHRDFYRNFTDAVDLVGTDFLPGEAVGAMPVSTAAGDLVLGIGICFEIILDDVMRDTVLEGAQILIVPTNNATFGFSDESVQQLAVSRVKAVELGRSVAHVSTVGVSGLILPSGEVLEGTELFTADLLSAELPLRSHQTIAVRLGPWPERVAIAGLAALLIGHAWQSRRDRLI